MDRTDGPDNDQLAYLDDQLAYLELATPDLEACVSRLSFLGVTIGSRAQRMRPGRELVDECLLRAGQVNIKVVSPAGPGKTSEFINKYGEGFSSVGIVVNDIIGVRENLTRAGVGILLGQEDLFGSVVHCLHVPGPGGLTHIVIPRSEWSRIHSTRVSSSLLEAIDHIAICLEPGTLETWSAFYTAVFEYAPTIELETFTSNSGMRSIVMSSGARGVQVTLLEPALGKRPSQIQRFLDENSGPGIQHVAVRSGSLLASARQAVESGIRMLEASSSYYEDLIVDIPEIRPELIGNEHLGILACREGSDGLVLQAFTEAIGVMGPWFVELIERRGKATGFGARNVQALFEAVERAQAMVVRTPVTAVERPR